MFGYTHEFRIPLPMVKTGQDITAQCSLFTYRMQLVFLSRHSLLCTRILQAKAGLFLPLLYSFGMINVRKIYSCLTYNAVVSLR